MIEVEFGILKEIPVLQKYGVVVAIANVTINHNGQQEDDAALILARRSFGFGRTHLILRQNMHGILDTESLVKMATNACTELFGHAMPDVTHRICDLILDYVDEVIMHPPEDVMIEQKRKEKEIERSGIIIKCNDTVLLDAS
ncbi:hypothetical protein [Acinetobacter baumannii]|uniref:hypothetical protein n=1 Tax=Acinetobacter baumannii TaxID=470 RepID=UPI003AF438AE